MPTTVACAIAMFQAASDGTVVAAHRSARNPLSSSRRRMNSARGPVPKTATLNPPIVSRARFTAAIRTRGETRAAVDSVTTRLVPGSRDASACSCSRATIVPTAAAVGTTRTSTGSRSRVRRHWATQG